MVSLKWTLAGLVSRNMAFCSFCPKSKPRPAFAARLDPRFAREVGSSNTQKIRKTGPSRWDKPVFGAAGQIRTADLVITNDALYRLSYSSRLSFSRALRYYSIKSGFVKCCFQFFSPGGLPGQMPPALRGAGNRCKCSQFLFSSFIVRT